MLPAAPPRGASVDFGFCVMVGWNSWTPSPLETGIVACPLELPGEFVNVGFDKVDGDAVLVDEPGRAFIGSPASFLICHTTGFDSPVSLVTWL